MTNDEIAKNAEVGMTKGKRFRLWLSVNVSHFIRAVLISGMALIFCGCTARYYRKSADKEVYKIIQEKQKAALGQTNAFTSTRLIRSGNPMISRPTKSLL